MQNKHLCWPPAFFLAPQWPPTCLILESPRFLAIASYMAIAHHADWCVRVWEREGDPWFLVRACARKRGRSMISCSVVMLPQEKMLWGWLPQSGSVR